MLPVSEWMNEHCEADFHSWYICQWAWSKAPQLPNWRSFPFSTCSSRRDTPTESLKPGVKRFNLNSPTFRTTSIFRSHQWSSVVSLTTTHHQSFLFLPLSFLHSCCSGLSSLWPWQQPWGVFSSVFTRGKLKSDHVVSLSNISWIIHLPVAVVLKLASDSTETR